MRKAIFSAMFAIVALMAVPQMSQASSCASPESCSMVAPGDPPAVSTKPQVSSSTTTTVTQPQPDGSIKTITTTVFVYDDGSTKTLTSVNYHRP